MVSLVGGEQSGLQMGVSTGSLSYSLWQGKIKGFIRENCSAMMTVEKWAGVGAMGSY